AAPASRLVMAPLLLIDGALLDISDFSCLRRRLQLFDHDITPVDHLAIVEIQRIAVQRDIEVARRAIRTAKLLIGAGGKKHVAVKGTAFLTDPSRVHSR